MVGSGQRFLYFEAYRKMTRTDLRPSTYSQTCLKWNLEITETYLWRKTSTAQRSQTSSTCIKQNLPAMEKNFGPLRLRYRQGSLYNVQSMHIVFVYCSYDNVSLLCLSLL